MGPQYGKWNGSTSQRQFKDRIWDLCGLWTGHGMVILYEYFKHPLQTNAEEEGSPPSRSSHQGWVSPGHGLQPAPTAAVTEGMGQTFRKSSEKYSVGGLCCLRRAKQPKPGWGLHFFHPQSQLTESSTRAPFCLAEMPLSGWAVLPLCWALSWAFHQTPDQSCCWQISFDAATRLWDQTKAGASVAPHKLSHESWLWSLNR